MWRSNLPEPVVILANSLAFFPPALEFYLILCSFQFCERKQNSGNRMQVDYVFRKMYSHQESQQVYNPLSVELESFVNGTIFKERKYKISPLFLFLDNFSCDSDVALVCCVKLLPSVHIGVVQSFIILSKLVLFIVVLLYNVFVMSRHAKTCSIKARFFVSNCQLFLWLWQSISVDSKFLPGFVRKPPDMYMCRYAISPFSNVCDRIFVVHDNFLGWIILGPGEHCIMNK